MNIKVNEIQLSYREVAPISGNPIITSSEAAYKVLRELWNPNTIGLHESFKVLLLNNSNKIKGVLHLSEGGITGALVDIRILFAVVLKSLSVGMILSHNHPSGQLKPSRADQQLTRKIQKSAKLFDVRVLDHLILSPEEGYFSFADEGLL
jgi:DNA repair protein RadC